MDKNDSFDYHLPPNPFSSPQTSFLSPQTSSPFPQTSSPSSQNSSQMDSAIVPRRTQMTSVASVEVIITPTKTTIPATIKDVTSDEDEGVSADESVTEPTPLLPTEYPLATRMISEAGPSIDSTTESSDGSSSLPSVGRLIGLDFHQETYDHELSWALESDEEGSFQAGIDWTDDEDEKAFYSKPQNDGQPDYDAEPSQVLTVQEIGMLGRRLAPLRKSPRARSPLAAFDLGSPDNKKLDSANIIGGDVGQSAAAIPNVAAPQASSPVRAAKDIAGPIPSCLNLGTTIPSLHHPSSTVRPPPNIADPIPSCLNIGVTTACLQDPVQTEPTFPYAVVEDNAMSGFRLFPFSSSGPPKITSDIPKEQMVSKGEFENVFATFNAPNGEQRSSSDSVDWQTLLSRAGVSGIPNEKQGFTNAFPMFQSDASQLFSSANPPYPSDVGMEDFGWLGDVTIDLDTILDPELAMANHLATMAKITAGSGAAIESSGNSAEDTELTTYNATEQVQDMSTVFNHSDMDLILYDIPEETPEALKAACGVGFQVGSWTTELSNTEASLADSENTSSSHQMVTETSEPIDWNLEDCLDALAMFSPLSSPTLQPSCDLSLPQPEGNNFEDYLCPTLPPAMVPNYNAFPASGTFPPFDPSLHPACSLLVSGSEPLNLDDHPVMGEGFSTQVEPDEMNIDGDISNVMLLSPTAIAISPEPSVPITSSPMIPILQILKPVTRPVIEKMDDDMIDMPDQSSDAVDSTLGAPLSFSSSSHDPDEQITTSSSQSISPSTLVAPVNEVELVAVDLPDIVISPRQKELAANDISRRSISEVLVSDEEIKRVSTESNYKATVSLSIPSAPEIKNQRNGNDVGRRERRERKTDIQIRKVTSRCRDLLEQKVLAEQAEQERTQLYRAKIVGLNSELEERKREEARCMEEQLSRQEVEIGVLAKELKAMRATTVELRKESERKDVEYARKNIEWEKAIREDERKMVQLRKVEDLRTMSDVYKALDSDHVTWDSWAKKVPGKVQTSRAVIPVPVEKLVTAVILPETSPPSLSIAVGRKTKTPRLSTTPPKVAAGRPILNRPLIDTLDRPYSIALASLIIVAMGAEVLPRGYSILHIIALGSCIWFSLRWDSRSSCRGYIVDVTLDLVRLAKALLFALTVTVLTGFAWLKAIGTALKRRAPVSAEISMDIDDVQLWEELPEVDFGVDEISEAGLPVDVVDAVRPEEPGIIPVENGEWNILEGDRGYESLAKLILGPVQQSLSCERYHFAVGAGEVATVEPGIIPVENGEWNILEGDRGYESLANLILGPVQQSLSSERYHFAVGAGEVVPVVEQLGNLEIGLNGSVGIEAVPGTAIGIEHGAMGLIWGFGVYRALMAWKRM